MAVGVSLHNTRQFQGKNFIYFYYCKKERDKLVFFQNKNATDSMTLHA
jgi:hypothetical protein